MIYDDDAVQAIEVDVWGAFGGAETWVPWSFGVTISRHINLFVNVFCLLINVWTYTVSLWSHGTCMTQSDKNHKKHLSKFVSQWRMRCMTTHSPTCWGKLSKVVRCHVFWHFKPRISFHMMLTLAYSDFHVSSSGLTKSISGAQVASRCISHLTQGDEHHFVQVWTVQDFGGSIICASCFWFYRESFRYIDSNIIQ